MIWVIMGVSGCGKTTLGRLAAERSGLTYWEADEFHPAANVDKMSRGIPLNDRDRLPWLRAIREQMDRLRREGESGIFSCSALKGSYRRFLEEECCGALRWVYLRGEHELIRSRLKERRGHFFQPSLLASQFADLEEPREALVIDASLPPEEMWRLFREDAGAALSGGNGCGKRTGE